MRIVAAALCLSAALTGCQATHPHPGVGALCELLDRPYSSAAEQRALRQQASDAIGHLRPFKGTKKNKAVFKAVLEISASVFPLPTSVPSPLASLLAVDANTAGSLAAGRADLRKACA
ncbi:MAG: hypothetical protein ABR549_06680 [Mycobacteriales bacterium]